MHIQQLHVKTVYMLRIRYIDSQLDKVFAENTDPLDRVRAEFLANSLLASLFIIIVTLPTFYSPGQNIPFIRSIVIGLVQMGLVWVILHTNKWKFVAHFACLIVASLIWSNLFVLLQGVKIISLQFMLLLIAMSYYLLGKRWGIAYSAICVVFMLYYFLYFDTNQALAKPLPTNNFTFITVFVFNFLLVIYLQYHFFNAFNGTIKQLKLKQIEEKLLNEKLQQAVHDAAQLAKVKSNFLSTISHELRTPLNGVIGMSNVLLLDNPRADQQENLSILKFSANNLLNLINDVLDINKIESGKIEIEKIPFQLYSLVDNIYKGFLARAQSKNLEFNLYLSQDLKGKRVLGDPTRLTQILNNLIENALKFTASGHVSVGVKLKSATAESVKVYFSISDTGIGIPAEKLKIVFESFSQASTSTTRTYGGTGLGLAIVKNLLELHQSEIKTKSEPNVGTSFEFEIDYPLTQQVLHPETDANDTRTDLSQLQILVAEDNQMNILLMRKLLSRWGTEPTFAENGEETIKAFEFGNFDLVLMDIHMPVMDGYEAASHIRNLKDPIKSAVPIIALTASVALDVRTKIAKAGINDFVSKPFNPDELRRKLELIASKKSESQKKEVNTDANLSR